jgi:hypothetical protein
MSAFSDHRPHARPRAALSRGWGVDYSWLDVDSQGHLAGFPGKLDKIKAFLPGSKPGVLIVSEGNLRWAIFLCNFQAGRQDSGGRRIRNSPVWTGLTWAEARGIGLWALEEWRSVEEELSRVFVDSQGKLDWALDEGELRLFEDKVRGTGFKSRERRAVGGIRDDQRRWLAYGEPQSGAWKKAAEELKRIENAPDCELALIISGDPNPEAVERLKSEAFRLVTETGDPMVARDWEDLEKKKGLRERIKSGVMVLRRNCGSSARRRVISGLLFISGLMTGLVLGRLEKDRRSKVLLLGPLISVIDGWKWVRGDAANQLGTPATNPDDNPSTTTPTEKPADNQHCTSD